MTTAARSGAHRTRWLGRQDSNLGSRDQNPLPYHLATPHTRRSTVCAYERVGGGRRAAAASEEAGDAREHGEHDERERAHDEDEHRDERDAPGSGRRSSSPARTRRARARGRRGRRRRRRRRRRAARQPGMTSKTTRMPSMTAIQRATRSRWPQPAPVRRAEGSTTVQLHRSTVPSRHRQPGSPEPPPGGARVGGGAVARRGRRRPARAGDVCAEGAELAQLRGERRRGQVVRRQRGEVAGPRTRASASSSAARRSS